MLDWVLGFLFGGLMGVGILGMVRSSQALKAIYRNHKAAKELIEAVYTYRRAVNWNLIEPDSLLGRNFDYDDVCKENIYSSGFLKLPTSVIYTDKEKYDRVMHYYEMFKGIDFDVFAIELDANSSYWDRLKETVEQYKNYKPQPPVIN